MTDTRLPRPIEEMRPRNFVITPQNFTRLRHCDASHIYVAKRPKPSFGQWHGIFVHRFLEVCTRDGMDAGWAYLRSKKKDKIIKLMQKIDYSKLSGPLGGQGEVSLLINTTTMTCIEADYAEADPDEHIYMKVDTIWKDVCWNVGDYKTGLSMPDPLDDQNVTHATALWLREGRPRHVNSHIIPLSDPELRFRSETLPAHFLSARADEIRRLHLRVLETRAEYREERALPSFEPGDWCETCPNHPVCPSRIERDHAKVTVEGVKRNASGRSGR
jgi:hypothetical protein